MSDDHNIFNEDAAFAKLVILPSGEDAMMIGGNVIQVYPVACAKMIVNALRSARSEFSTSQGKS